MQLGFWRLSGKIAKKQIMQANNTTRFLGKPAGYYQDICA